MRWGRNRTIATMLKKFRFMGTIVVTFLVTSVLVLLVLNFTTGEEEIQHQIPRLYTSESPQFERAMGVLLGPGIVSGNEVTELLNGDQIFPPMLDAIRNAKNSITFETYIYWSGDIGRQFADALSERARSGVAVHVLLDWVGSAKIEESFLSEMKEAGVEIEKFHKPSWYDLARLNNRTHRKILVVDGAIGFTEEYDLQLFTRRLHAWRQTAGSEAYWYGVSGEALLEHRGMTLDLVRRITDVDMAF